MSDENGNKTFVRITNKMIYDKIDHMEDKLDVVVNDTETNKENIKTNKKSIWWLWTGIGGMALGIIFAALRGAI